MTKLRLFAFLLALAPAFAAASSGGDLMASGADLSDKASLQRGAGLYMNYCAGCHSLSLMRYSRLAEDLDLTQEQVEEHLIVGDAKFGESIVTGVAAADGQAWFGKAPPDLSLVARAKAGGADWVYTYLKSFYVDESRPIGWNNKLFPGVSMPNALWELQGIQRPVMDEGHDGEAHISSLELVTPGRLDSREFDQAARDISNFLQYTAEPAALQRESVGVWVILFLALVTFIAYLLKLEYWRDVH